MSRHIFLTGEKQVGKSTLLRKLLEGETRSLGGFLTVKTDEVFEGCPSVHLLRVAAGERPAPENLLFFCGAPWTEETARRFDKLGCAALADTCSAELLIMDELGPTEAKAAAFQGAVFQSLDGDIPILGVLQKADATFTQRIAEHPNVRVLEVVPENREHLLYALKCQMEETRRLSEEKF